MKIWLPPENDGGARITAGVIAIVALAMALTVGGTLELYSQPGEGTRAASPRRTAAPKL